MTAEELSHYDGQNGRKAYVAYQGKIYDVTESDLWKEGKHEDLHFAGRDLSEAMSGAPHGEEVFKKFQIVGTLEEAQQSEEEKSVKEVSQKVLESTEDSMWERSKSWLREWYYKYHPHPMVVHFPIALHFFAGGVDLIFLYTLNPLYEIAIFYAFFVATIMGFVAMVPGILSWWINYGFSKARPFMVKLYVSLLTLLLGVIGVGIRIANSNVAFESSFESMLYHFSILVTVPTIVILAYYGGKISWPDRNKRKEENVTDDASAMHIPEEQHFAGMEGENSLPVAIERSLPSDMRPEEVLAYPPGYQKGTHSYGNPICIRNLKQDFSILISGPAGAGIQTVELSLLHGLRKLGFGVYSIKEYMSRVRGGSNTALVRFGHGDISAPCWKVDLVVALDGAGLEHVQERITEDTVILADISQEKDDSIHTIPASEIAGEVGHIKYANSVIAGAVFGLLGLDLQILIEGIPEKFSEEIREKNKQALEHGYAYVQDVEIKVQKPLIPHTVSQKKILNGTTACGFGFLAGGCDFVSSYPMSPSTGVLTFMAETSLRHTVLIEQAEDEIAALNMVIGAWYAGGRGLTTTSGGGFALMSEAMSLAGMTESPAVIYLAQRPGPATGLPTRTEQGDLQLALYAGHGEFPRILLAPGDVNECLDMAYLAFETADRFQVPVVLLSDQYLSEANTAMESVDLTAYPQVRYIDTTQKNYQRFELTDDGVSPRGIPGFGEGLVCCDSDEHDEQGQITEDYKIRELMVKKRQRKLREITQASVGAKIYASGSIALVGWGSTKGVIAEAIQMLGDERLYQIHYPWVYPLSDENLQPLRDTECVILVENNSNGQFASLLKLHGITPSHVLLQSNGFPFFSDQLAKRIKEVV